ncbi:DUF6298 domain-containing protein [uncultured Bacteroides sp.]|uniref:DUF6298 domain-containing protein n=1 Tax=uncultured Bacteroides sp. TaxID=162156 RepID=UPI002AAAF00C|nr:DUF6298 domain-containing protein [uncultured Bacteroides sp.]
MKRNKLKLILLGLASIAMLQSVVAQDFDLKVNKGKLTYLKDEKGNRILDFSFCGYRNSDQDIPTLDNVVFVPCKKGDSWVEIQKAIDYVSTLKPDKKGFRGAVLLDKGMYTLSKELRIGTSGVVLRGTDKNETVLLKKGVDRGALIYIEGINNQIIQDTLNISSRYVPVNDCTLEVPSAAKLHVGDRVIVRRPSTKEWIASVGCDIYGGGISALGWKPGDTDMFWDRIVTSIEGNKITLDVPLTVALDTAYGISQVMPYHWSGRISDSGVENMTLVSDYDKKYPEDEDHCWTGISIENAENCWVRRVNFKHFSGNAVFVQRTASKVTVEDCISKEPISEIGGMRRCTFFTMGQLTLFQRCYSEHGIHDFSAGFCAPGPNAFVQCESTESLGFSGSIDAWACGLLFDVVNIDGHNLTYKNLGQDKNGAGWNTANSLFWQCTAAEIECYTPAKDAQNRAYGCWAQFSGDGQWAESNNHVSPRSFFYAQLADRLKKECSERARILPRSTSATSSPTVEMAMKLTKEAYIPRLTLEKWINEGTFNASVNRDKVKSVDRVKVSTGFVAREVALENRAKHSIGLKDGRIVMDGALMVGSRQEVPWWNGKVKTNFLPFAKPHVTRFVPGREGLGLTDRIDSVVNYMKAHNMLLLDHNYGLWYDLRRDDHERVRRRDGDVWAPLYEQPFSRSGEGTAWDGLSKYDLNRPNAWYWSRLKQFADKGEQVGLLLFHENYFQHNIIEAGAHWVDCPWRPVNNINNTGFPEPVPFAGDKRLFLAEMFYDVTNPVRRELHEKYIRQCLDNFADNNNVVQLISAEFTGPLHFVQFWIDVIAKWEKETGKHPLIALSTTKDVQDAILNDPKRSAIVDIIDIRYWHYKKDGTVYAPEGGKNMAPRQFMRKMKVGKISFESTYKAVNEYRQKYPDKAVTFFAARNYRNMAWAIFMAGGSCPQLPVKDERFLSDAVLMKIENTGTDGSKKMVNSDIGAIVYSQSEGEISLDLSAGRYCLSTVELGSGLIHVIDKSLKIKGLYKLKTPPNKKIVYWFHKL